MTYTLQEQYTSKNYTPAASVPATFGYPREVKYLTIHHWGLPGQQFDIVRDFLCTNNTPTSAHFVAQEGLVACIVNPDDAAWHAGNARGNAQSIGIECHPEGTDGDYETIAELIAYLRGIYGDIPLVPHNYWTSTACPGDYDLNRLDSLARGISVQSNPVTPVEQDEFDMASIEDLKAALVDLAQNNSDFRNAIADAVLTRKVTIIDPSGATKGQSGQQSDLATKIAWFAHNDAELLNAVTALKSTGA